MELYAQYFIMCGHGVAYHSIQVFLLKNFIAKMNIRLKIYNMVLKTFYIPEKNIKVIISLPLFSFTSDFRGGNH